MFENAGEFFGSSLKINFKIGDINFEIKLISPDFCAIFAMPSQKAIIPIKPIETWTALCVAFKSSFVTSSVFPV